MNELSLLVESMLRAAPPRLTALPPEAGERLRALRLAAGLGVTEAAGFVGVSRQMWGGYERGRHPVPLDVFNRFLAELNLRGLGGQEFPTTIGA